MLSDQVRRYLHTEKLYAQLIELIPEATLKRVGGESHVRGILDGIMSMGKVEGRLTGFMTLLNNREAVDQRAESDRLIEDWLNIAHGGVPRETLPDEEGVASARIGQTLHVSESIRPVLRVMAYARAPMWGKDIARAAGISYTTAYPHLRRLVEHGWAKSSRGAPKPGGQRLYYLMTPDGRIQAKEVLKYSSGPTEEEA